MAHQHFPRGAGGSLMKEGCMRLWTWEVTGPDQPEYLKPGDIAYDEEDLCWTLDLNDQWWPPGDPEKCPEDLYGFPMHWSILLEMRGPLRSKPRQDAPMPQNDYTRVNGSS